MPFSAVDVALSVPQPYLPGPAIYVDGTNITKADGDPVLYASARFMSAVNGVAGEAHFRVRDDLGTANYVPGQALQLIIDGQPAWTGFVTNVKRVYVFPALNVDDFGPTRFFDIDGTDLNILLTRRIVFNQSTPANVLAPLYPTFTPDITAISDLIEGWLDLTGDALDTSTDVHHVGAINEDQLARAWEGSDTWGQAMTSITALPASIFYIRPNRVFAYVDTDTPDAPFGLSDVPDGITSKGYREMEVLFDGTNLANDVLAWGVGYGSNAPVFTRDEDATSQSEHGRWQLGQTSFGVYRQATVNRIADSILNGSPDHHRGAKDDRHAVTLVTYEPGLLPAQKVAFESNVFGYSEVLPIRKMEITFPTPDAPRYELALSQEIDTPWSFFDPFRLGGFGLPPFPPLPPLPPFPPFPPTNDCLLHVGEHVMIDNSGRNSLIDLGSRTTNGVIYTFRINFDEASRTVGGATTMAFAQNGPLNPVNYSWSCEVRFFSANAGTRLQVKSNQTINNSTIYLTGKQGEWLTVKVVISGHNVQAKMWLDQTETEPGGYQVNATGVDAFGAVLDPASAMQYLSVGGGPFFGTTSTTLWNFIDIPGFGTETFNRSATGDWGTSEFSGSPLWTANTGSGSVVVGTITGPGDCGQPFFGPLREDATRIDSTHYQLSRSILPNSAFVFLDGFIATLGTDFTEDDAAGRIVFASAIGAGVVVTVRYVAAGPTT